MAGTLQKLIIYGKYILYTPPKNGKIKRRKGPRSTVDKEEDFRGNNTSVLWERRRRYILEEGAMGSHCGK